MFWIIALVILAIGAAEGYFIGAVRAAFAFVGLVLACLLAVPLSPLAKPVVGLFGIHYFLWVTLLAPLVVWIVILLVVRAAGESLNYKVNYFYKYKVGDEMRLLWQRLVQRVGLGVGVLNGAMYFYALSVLVFTVSYPVMQVASSDQDPFMMRLINQLGKGLKNSGMDKAIAPFVPQAEQYYQTADVIGLIYQNPQIQDRLGRYPPFLSLMERPEYQVLATDKDFQSTWKSHPPFLELVRQEKLHPLVTNQENYQVVMDMLGGDLTDLQTYLETGKSPKYADTLILGKWRFSMSRSYRLARRANLGASPIERLLMRRQLESTMNKAKLTVFPDGKLLLRSRTTNHTDRVIQGTWKRKSRHTYTLNLSGDGGREKTEADVEEHIMQFKKGGKPLVFLKP